MSLLTEGDGEPDDCDAEESKVEAIRPAVGEAHTVCVTVIVTEEEFKVSDSSFTALEAVVVVEESPTAAAIGAGAVEDSSVVAEAAVVEEGAGMVVAVYMSANPLDEDSILIIS